MIVDHRGNPIQREVLSEPQTARLAHLHREFQSHPSRGLTPARLASILEEAEQGQLMSQHELFADMEEKDGHIMAELAKRKRALLGVSWDIAPPPDASRAEKKAAAAIKEMLTALPDIEDVILDIADAIGHGFSCQELEWGRVGAWWVPRQVHFRAQSWFMTTQERRDELRLRDVSPTGAELLPFGWIVHVHRARSGYLARAGLHRTLAWPYLFKNYAVRDLAEMLEIYGLPIRIGTYPRNAGDNEKRTLLSALVSLGHNAAGIIPEGMKIEFQEAAKGDKTPFETMIDWCERTESKAILGATLTSQTDGGSGAYALGNVHRDVMWDLTLSDCRQVASTLTRSLIWPLCALNLPGISDPMRVPRFEFDTELPEDMKRYADALPHLVKVGMQIPEAWAREKLRIPQAEEGEAVLSEAADAAPEVAPTDATAAARAALRTASSPVDVIDRYLERALSDGAESQAAMVETVRVMLERANSLEEFRAMLLAAYSEMDVAQLGEALQQALASAELAGRFEVETGAGG